MDDIGPFSTEEYESLLTEKESSDITKAEKILKTTPGVDDTQMRNLALSSTPRVEGGKIMRGDQTVKGKDLLGKENKEALNKLFGGQTSSEDDPSVLDTPSEEQYINPIFRITDVSAQVAVIKAKTPQAPNPEQPPSTTPDDATSTDDQDKVDGKKTRKPKVNVPEVIQTSSRLERKEHEKKKANTPEFISKSASSIVSGTGKNAPDPTLDHIQHELDKIRNVQSEHGILLKKILEKLGENDDLQKLVTGLSTKVDNLSKMLETAAISCANPSVTGQEITRMYSSLDKDVMTKAHAAITQSNGPLHSLTRDMKQKGFKDPEMDYTQDREDFVYGGASKAVKEQRVWLLLRKVRSEGDQAALQNQWLNKEEGDFRVDDFIEHIESIILSEEGKSGGSESSKMWTQSK